MKKFFAVFLSCIVFFSLAVPSFAESINISTEISDIITYYSKAEKYTFDSFEEVYTFYAVNATSSTYDESALFQKNKSYSELILARLSSGKSPTEDFEGKNPVDMLAATQNENGSFGTFGQHFSAIAALEGTKALYGNNSITYGSKNAISYLLSLQKENGSFGDTEKTAKSIVILSKFADDEKAKSAMEAAKNYLKNTEFTALTDLCWAVTGLADAGESSFIEPVTKIVSFKNEDGSYPDGQTLTVLIALDAAANSQSEYGRLINNGSYKTYTFNQIIPFIIGFAVLALLSVGFWIYIMNSKKLKKRQAENDVQNLENSSAV